MSKRRKSSRRDFLKGRAVVDRMLDAADGEQASIDRNSTQAETARSYLIHVARRAMACEFQVFFNARQYPLDTATALEALDEVERLESQMSVYRDDSELSRINRRAGHEAIKVEPRLFSLFQLAMNVSEATDGAYDITAGPLSRAWGFFRRAGSVPSDEALADARANVGWRNVWLDEATCCVRFEKPGMELSVNSLGKGYALDRCALRLAEAGIDDYLFHGGQSSVLARGRRSDRLDGWTVGVRHPLAPERHLAEIVLCDAALATSGNATQSFLYQGVRYGHVLDPRTARPATGVYSATVVAREAALADALSTACYVLGPEKAIEVCRQFEHVGCLIVSPGQRDHSIRVDHHGLEPIAHFNAGLPDADGGKMNVFRLSPET